MWKRCLAFAMAMVLILHFVPTTVYAEEGVEPTQNSAAALESEEDAGNGGEIGGSDKQEQTAEGQNGGSEQVEPEENDGQEKLEGSGEPEMTQSGEDGKSEPVQPEENNAQEKPEENIVEEPTQSGENTEVEPEQPGQEGIEQPEEDAGQVEDDGKIEEETEAEKTEEGESGEEQTETESDIAEPVYAVGDTGEYQPEGASYQLTYTVVDDGVKITGITGTKEGELKIPATIGGMDVVEIGDEAFYNCYNLKGGLTIPDSVRVIGEKAFQYCQGLIGKLVLPKDLTDIGNSAFYSCSRFSGELVIPNQVKSIGSYAFSGCSGFSGDLVIPNKIEKIDSGIFKGCNGFSGDLVIPDSVTYIGYQAFSGCRGFLGELVISDNVTYIGYDAFSGCSGFSGELVIPEKVTDIDGQAFYGCRGFSGKLIIPNSVKTVGHSAFVNCNNISEITIQEGVEKIDRNAFGHKESIGRKIYIYSDSISIGEGALGIGNTIYGNSESRTEIYVKGALDGSDNTFVYLGELPVFKEYRVTNTEELINAIGSHRKIILADGMYDLYGNPYDDTEKYLEISGRVDLSIEAEHPGKVELLLHDMNNPVIDISGSADISITGCILGHESVGEEWGCGVDGSVVSVGGSGNVKISKCDLYGCGVWGVSAYSSTANVEESVIRDCSEGIIRGNGISSINKCVFSGNAYNTTWEHPAFNGASNMTVSNCTFMNNQNPTLFDGNAATAENCTFYNNVWDGETVSDQSSGIDLNGITWQLDGTVLKLGYPLELDKGTIESKTGKVMDYSSSAAPWKNCAFTEVQYAEGIEKPDKEITSGGSEPAPEPEPGEPDPAEPVQLKAPVASIPSGSEVESGRKLRLTTDIAGTQIYYTLDGQEPTKESILYTAPIVITADVTVKAVAVKEGYLDSTVTVFAYRLVDDTGKGEIEEDDWTQVDGPGTEGVPQGLWITAIPVQKFTGKAIKPTVRVYNRNTLLIEKRDYTLSYKNNTKANDATREKTAPQIVVTGKGNYKDKAIKTFVISPKNLADADVMADPITLKAVVRKDGSFKEQEPIPKVIWNGKKLANGRDFDVAYPDTTAASYQAPGIYKIVLSGKGNYIGTREVELKIIDGKPVSKLTVGKIKDQIYTGDEIRPQLTVKDGRAILTEGVDYKVNYENNIAVGKASAVIEGMGDSYIGRKRVEFKIKAIASLKNAKVEFSTEEKRYSGTEVRPKSHKLILKVNGSERTLVEGKDYSLSYLNNVKKGTATAVFTGMSGYDGVKKKTYVIMPYDISKINAGEVEQKITVEMEPSYAYTKGGCTPKPVIKFEGRILKEKVDYTLSYINNKGLNDGSNTVKLPTVMINGKGNFKGKLMKTFLIRKKNIGELSLAAADKLYKARSNIYKTSIVIKDSNGKKLAAGQDYDKNKTIYVYDTKTMLDDGTVKQAGTKVGNRDIIPAGTVIRVIVLAKGKYYYGNVSGTYRFTEKSIVGLSAEIPPQTYTGRAIEPDGEVTVWVNKKGQQKVSEADYDIVGYSNNVNKGTATMTIRGKNNYGGVRTVKFKIVGKGISWWKKN